MTITRPIPTLLAAALLAVVAFVETARATHEPAPASVSGVCVLVPLAFGPDAAAASIAASGETDCWRFDGAAGDRVRLRVVRTAGTLDPVAAIRRPDGTPACAATAADDSTCVLTAGGTHSITVRDGAGTATGDYRIAVQRLNDPVGCSARSFGPATSSGGLAAAGETDCWRFDGAAGDRVRLRLVTASAALSPRAEILRPDGTTLCAPALADGSTCVLATGGAHTILVADSPGTDTGGYAIAVQRLNDPAGCSPLPFGGTATAGAIATTGETDCWRFTGAAGDQVRLRALETSAGLAAGAEFLRPDGTTVCGASGSAERTCRLDAGGTHTILVADLPSGTHTGNYRVAIQRLNAPVGCSTAAFGTGAQSASIATVAETDCRRFTAAAGDRVRLRVIATAGAVEPVAEVVRPDGTTVCAGTTADDSTCVVDAAGTHTILVRDASGIRYGDYAVAIQRLNSPVGCSSAAYGTTAAPGTIGAAGAIGCWRFTGGAGDRVRLRPTTTWGGLSARAEVVRPDGTTDCPPASEHHSTCVLDVAGDHTILVTDSPGTDTGGYVVALQRLSFPVGCSALAFGPPPATGSIGAAGESECWRFDGAAGDRVRLSLQQTSGSLSERVEVLRPNGTTVCYRLLTCVLDAAGTHTVLVADDSGTGTGTFAVAIQRLNNPVGCSSLPRGGGPSAGWIGTAAETDCWRIDGTAGEQLELRVLATSGTLEPELEVVRPDGATRCRSDNTNNTPDDFSCALDANGTHTILVGDAGGSDTGGYEISNPPTIQSGTIGGGSGF